MPPPGGTSDVWKYFRKIDANSASCKICFKVLKSSGNTSNLKKHLSTHSQSSKEKASSKKKTPSLTNNPSTSESQDEGTAQEERMSDDVTIATGESERASHEATETTANPANTSHVAESDVIEKASSDSVQVLSKSSSSRSFQKSQLTIEETFQRAASYSDGGIRYETFIKHLLYFICVDNRPFHIVHGKGFQRLMKILAPNIKVPSEDTLKRRLDDLYDVVLQRFVSKFATFSDNDNYALTFDIWSEMMSARGFLGVTIHYLEGSELKSKILTTQPLAERHTAVNIKEHMENCISKFGLKKQNISAVVTDNGNNVVAAVNLLLDPARHLPCFAHTINRVVEITLEADDADTLIQKVRTIVIFIKNSVNQSDLLRSKQGAKKKKLKLDVKTRWNSTFYMLERYIELRGIVNEILLETPNAPDILTATENNIIQKIMLVLQPFEYVTRDISGEKYSTMSKIIPTVNCLREQIKDIKYNGADEQRIVEPLKERFLKEINNRFGPIENNHNLAVATLLDPRFKNIHFSNANACARTISFIRRTVNADDNNGSPPPTIQSSESENEEKFDFWSPHRKLAYRRRIRQQHDGEKDEMALYLANPVCPLKSDIFQQWEDMKSVFPKLYAMSRKYLIVPGTSVPSERLFSKAGATMSEARNRLAGSKLDKLLFLSDCSETDWGF